MKVYINPEKELWDELTARPVVNTAALEKTVRKIMQKVKEGGDKAVRKCTKEFDGVKLKKLQVSAAEIAQAETLLDDNLKKAMGIAKNNIESFHLSQKEEIKKTETMPGVLCWRQALPVEKIGLYIPGGTAPLFSTVLMLGIPAQIAGCKKIILCTPPGKDGNIHPAILYAAKLCGISEIFKAGGVQAIAAMCYGTATIPKVYKIFGPGNQYVTAAKQAAQLKGTAIDMPAGPSELLVIADETAHPEFAAADLLSQAEHGTDSQVVLVTNDERVGQQVLNELNIQLENLPRKKIAKEVLKNSKMIILKDIKEAIDFSNVYAPEHLILSCNNAENEIGAIRSAGSVFIGHYSPESAGDYASGTNHTLPTNGFAAMYSGVSLDSFVKKITFQLLTKQGLENIGDTVMTMAAAEGLTAHRNAVAARLKK